MSQPSEAEWRNRFLLINLVRIGGTVMVMIGLLIWQTDMLRPGGSVEIGLPLALVGLTISFGLSQYLVRRWRTPRP
jgi:hypothetical protein